MKRILLSFSSAIFIIFLLSISVLAQGTKPNAENETCSQPIYDRKEVSHPAKFTFRPEPRYTEEARAKQLEGQVVLDTILCKSGRVTDIIVVEGQAYGMTEGVIEVTRQVKFIPAEKDGQPVSQRQRFIYQFNLH
jgi:TonB family protein